MTQTRAKGPRIQLKQEQLFALYNWLKAYPFAERKPTDIQVLTNEAAAQLLFPLTANNMRSAMKVVGVVLAEVPKPATPNEVFAHYLMVLCEESGVEIGADLRSLANIPVPSDPQQSVF